MRITSVKIFNYRAFLNLIDDENEKYNFDLAKGQNVLIYGENGSGKSSLFNGLRDFILSASEPKLIFSKNHFYDEGKVSDKPHIRLKFSDDIEEYYFSSDKAQTNTSSCSHIKKGNSIYGFLSYRDLFKLHLHESGSEKDFFDLFFGSGGLFSEEILLSPKNAKHKMPFQELWNLIGKNKDGAALDDYNTNAAAVIADLEPKINKLLSFFEKSINLKIEYKDGSIATDLIPPKILFHVKLFNKDIPSHHGFLNEARLTSLAISVYLSRILSLPDAPFKVLFLDDIFIGLDMSNRVPLLDILNAEDLGAGASFRKFQLFVTTYDREWFEIAKKYLKSDWQKIEFFVDDHSSEIERPFVKKTGSYKERAYSHLTEGDYPASANYLRKAFENELRRILPANQTSSGYTDPSNGEGVMDISKHHFDISENSEAWVFKVRDMDLLQGTGSRYIGLDILISRFESLILQYKIPFSEINNLKIIKNRLLNPFSHDDLKSPIFKRELLIAFELLEDLESVKSKVILNIEKESPLLLNITHADYKGKSNIYRFEILENLRYFEYKTEKLFFNAKCRSIEKIIPQKCQIFPGQGKKKMEHEYSSLTKLCNAIQWDSGDPKDKKNLTYDANLEFNLIFEKNGKKLIDLING